MPAKTRRTSPEAPGLISDDRDPATVRAALIVRLSDWVDGTTSVDRQRKDGLDFIRSQGWNFDPDTDTFEDIDISGWKEVRRPGLEALLARLNDYDVVVFWKLDRVFRSVKRFLAFLEACEEAKTGLRSVQEGFLDTTNPIGRMVAVVLMAIAEMESVNTSIRVRSTWAHKRQQGIHIGNVPYGWKLVLDQAGRRLGLALDPITSEVVLAMVQAYLAGNSARAIARDLNDMQIPSPAVAAKKPKEGDEPEESKTGVWLENAVAYILRNPVLIGQMLHDGGVVVDDQGMPLTPNEPLIDVWTYTRLQEELEKRRPKNRGPRKDQRLLRGIVRCGCCGLSMRGNGGAGTHRSTYACIKDQTRRLVCSQPNAISCRRLEEHVRQWLFGYLTGEVMDQAAELRRQEEAMLSGPDPDTDRRQKLTAALNRLEEDRQAGLYDAPAAAERFREQHRSLMAQLAALKPAPGPLSALTGLPAVQGRIEDVWDDLEPAVQHQILVWTIDHIEVQPRREDAPKGRFFDVTRVTIVPRRFDSVEPSVSVDTEMQKAAS